MSEVTRIQRLTARGMITLRGDLEDSVFVDAIRQICGVAMPEMRGIAFDDDRGLAWMSPDEVLILLPQDAVTAMVAKLEAALAGVHHLVADVTDARAMFRIWGPAAREVIAKGAPVDMHPDSFGEGQIRRTRLGQVAAAFWLAAPDEIHLICFRSVAGFVDDWLANAARPGAEVGFF